jgi:hypothetical protein
MSAQPEQGFSSEHGTLGIVILTRSGIVFAADSRSTKADGTFEDTATKVFKISHDAACTIAGTVALQHSFFGHIVGFDFAKAVEEYPVSMPMGLPADMSSQAMWLGRILTRRLQDGLFSTSTSEFSDGGNIATFIVAGYSWVGRTRGLEAYKLALGAAAHTGSAFGARLEAREPTLTRAYRAPWIEQARFAVFVNGNAQVALGILEGDPQSEASLKIPAIAQYHALRRQGKLDEMNLEHAVALAEALVGESIRIAGRALGIGGQIDIARITPDEGFAWVPGHEPERKQPSAPAQ